MQNYSRKMNLLVVVSVLVCFGCQQIHATERCPSLPDWVGVDFEEKYIGYLKDVHYDPYKTLPEIYPELGEYSEERIDYDHCYDTYNYKGPVNVFVQPLFCVVARYFDEQNTLYYYQNANQIKARVASLVPNLKVLAELILECSKKPKSQQTRLGLSPLASYNDQQFAALLDPKLMSRLNNYKTENCILNSANFDVSLRSGKEKFISDPKIYYKDIKSQVQREYCSGSVYFAAVALLEHHAHRCNERVDSPHYSEQALVDCFGDGACAGIGQDSVIEYIAQKGVTLDFTNQHYGSYYGKPNPDGQKCDEVKDRYKAINATNDNYCQLFNQTDQDIKLLLIKYGPLIVFIDASGAEFRWYLSNSGLHGTYRGECKNESESANMAALLVGWIDDKWVIRNAWSVEWGVSGYVHLPMGENKCGVNNYVGLLDKQFCNASEDSM